MPAWNPRFQRTHPRAWKTLNALLSKPAFLPAAGRGTRLHFRARILGTLEALDSLKMQRPPSREELRETLAAVATCRAQLERLRKTSAGRLVSQLGQCPTALRALEKDLREAVKEGASARYDVTETALRAKFVALVRFTNGLFRDAQLGEILAAILGRPVSLGAHRRWRITHKERIARELDAVEDEFVSVAYSGDA